MSALDEAAERLEHLGRVATPDGLGDSRHRLVVHHDDAMAFEVRRVVEIIDPAAARVR
jgi:hypothetical protein